MSEFEIAIFASQEATRAYQQAALEISRAGITAIYIQAGVAAAGVLIHGILIAWGLRLMRRSADHRDDQHKATMAALELKRRALETLIERTAPPES